MFTRTPGAFAESTQALACTIVGVYSVPSAGLCTCPGWISERSCWPIPPACQSPPGSAFQHIIYSPQLEVVKQLDWGICLLLLYITGKGIKQNRCQDWPLRNSTCNEPPGGGPVFNPLPFETKNPTNFWVMFHLQMLLGSSLGGGEGGVN